MTHVVGGGGEGAGACYLSHYDTSRTKIDICDSHLMLT